MAELKTKKTTASVSAFIAGVPDEAVRKDCATLVKLMKRVAGSPAAMWGPSIVGFGTYHYVYASGQSGDWPLVAFSPRKRELVLYVLGGFPGYPALMKKLGRCRTGKVCIYVKSLSDLDSGVLEELLVGSVAYVRKLYPMPATPAKNAAMAAAKKAAKKKTATKKLTRAKR